MGLQELRRAAGLQPPRPPETPASLPPKPDVRSAGGPPARPGPRVLAPPAPEPHRKLDLAPRRQGDPRGHGPGAAGQRLAFHAALVGPDEPRLARPAGARDEVDVGARRGRAADRTAGPGPGPARSTASMSSTRMTRCGTPTVANADPALARPRPRARPAPAEQRRSRAAGSRPGRRSASQRAWITPASVSRHRSPGGDQLEVDREPACCRAPRCRTWPRGTRPSSRTPSGPRRDRRASG